MLEFDYIEGINNLKNWILLYTVYDELDLWDLKDYNSVSAIFRVKEKVWELLTEREDWVKQTENGPVEAALDEEITPETLEIFAHMVDDIFEMRGKEYISLGRRIMLYELIRGFVMKLTNTSIPKDVYQEREICKDLPRVENWTCQNNLGIKGYSSSIHCMTKRNTRIEIHPYPYEEESVSIDSVISN